MSPKITRVILGGEYANCYLIKDEASGKTAIVDPGLYAAGLLARLRDVGYGEIEYILLTHGHYDHILGASGFKTATGAKIVIHKNEEDFLRDDSKSLISYCEKGYVHPTADIVVSDGDEIALGGTSIKVMHTPGHTDGSVCFIVGNTIISGDTLFEGNIGRWDLPTGDFEKLKESLKDLYYLEGDYEVFPGHGGDTTLEKERQNNPYMKGL